MEAVVEDAVGFGAEDEGVGGGFEIYYFFVFVEFVVGAAEGGQVEVAGHERVGSGSEDTSVVDAPAVDAAVVEQQEDEPVDGCEFLYFGVALRQQGLHLSVVHGHQ